MTRWLAPVFVGAITVMAAPTLAKDSLGVFDQWAAFRDAETPRCYAISESREEDEEDPRGYASIGTWPLQNVRGQLHIRLSRELAPGARVRLTVGRRGFTLTATGRDAWATDKAMDAAVIAAMRSATRMSVRSRAVGGRRFTDRYTLEGAATAMDASLLGCA